MSGKSTSKTTAECGRKLGEKEHFLLEVSRSWRDGDFIKLTLGKCRGAANFRNISVVPLLIRGELKLNFSYRSKTNEVHRNLNLEDALAEIERCLGSDFLAGKLTSTAQEVLIEYSRKRVPHLATRPVKSNPPKSLQHNREKSRIIDPGAEYLKRLEITDQSGRIKVSRYDKFRQIDKFVEIFDSLLGESGCAGRPSLKVHDFGSGKSYLTFAVYDYLRTSGAEGPKVTGVELRSELVSNCNAIAAACGFTGLSFVEGAINNIALEKTDVVIALHACDTATDDALLQAVRAEAAVIIVAPCCHKYLRARIKMPGDLLPVFKHGILEERLAVSLTDGLRALSLETQGYKVKVFEFISSEHTAKNVMIAAIRSGHSRVYREEQRRRIMELKSRFGLRDFYLDSGLGLFKEQDAV